MRFLMGYIENSIDYFCGFFLRKYDLSLFVFEERVDIGRGIFIEGKGGSKRFE